jgi:hypothetical protein
MSTTPELIDVLVEGATPVKALRPPLARACAWLMLAGLIVALLAVLHGLRPDLGGRLQQWEFLAGLAAALATGALAALAAFMISVPDRVDGWLWLPLPALAAWASTIGYGCFADWVSVGPEGLQWGETARCFATVLLTSVPLGLALAGAARRAAARPRRRGDRRARGRGPDGGSAVTPASDRCDRDDPDLERRNRRAHRRLRHRLRRNCAALDGTALRFAPTRTLPEGVVQ